MGGTLGGVTERGRGSGARGVGAGGREAGGGASARAAAIAAAAVALATLLAYLPALRSGFVNWDDEDYVVENRMTHGLSVAGVRWALTTFHSSNWHPLTWLSHMADGTVYGLIPFGHHLTSVLLHAANAALLLLVLYRMTRDLAPSLVVAALFALHPLNVESVAWVSERKNVLSTFFWIMTIGAHARYAERPGAARYAAVVALFALGLLSKPMLVTLPFVLLLLDAWPLSRFSRRAVVEKLPLLALAAASAAVTVIAQRAGRSVISVASVPVEARVTNAVVAYVRYLLKAVWPSGLSAYVPLATTGEAAPIGAFALLASLVALAGVTILAVRARRRAPHLLVGWLWYLIALVPVIGLVQVGGQAMADRYAYITLIGVFVAVAWSVPGLRRWPPAPAIAATAAAALVALGVTTARRERVWRDSGTLWAATLQTNPDSRVARANYGNWLVEQGRREEGLAQLWEALALDPRGENARLGAAHRVAAAGQHAAALAAYRAARPPLPLDPVILVNMGMALTGLGRPADALAYFEEAIRQDSERPAAEYNLANALADLGRFEEAAVHYRRALAADATSAGAWHNLAIAELRRGAVDEALAAAEQSVRLQPGDADMRYALGLIRMARGDSPAALEAFRDAVRLSPEFAEARVNLGVVLASMGRFDEAIAAYEGALRTQPANVEAHNNLALALAAKGRWADATRALRAAVALAPADIGMANTLAWFLATSPADGVRNGPEAVAIAQRVVEATARRDARALDTLGASYAEAGRFAEAKAAAAEALAVARAAADTALASEIDGRLAGYARGEAFRAAGA